MTIKNLLLSPYHFVLLYVMLRDYVTTMRTGSERGGSSIWKVKIPYNNSFLTTRGQPALRLDDHKKLIKISPPPPRVPTADNRHNNLI